MTSNPRYANGTARRKLRARVLAARYQGRQTRWSTR